MNCSCYILLKCHTFAIIILQIQLRKCDAFETLACLVQNETLQKLLHCIHKYRGLVTVEADRLREEYAIERYAIPVLCYIF